MIGRLLRIIENTVEVAEEELALTCAFPRGDVIARIRPELCALQHEWTVIVNRVVDFDIE